MDGPWRLSGLKVNEVDEPAWERFASGAELEFSLDYLRYADAAGQGDRVLVTAWDDRSHRIVGAMPVTRVSRASFWLSRPAAVLGGQVADGSATLESAYEDALYPAVSVRNICDASPLITAPGRERAAILSALVDQVIAQAKDWGMRSVTFLPVSAEDAALRTVLERRGFAAATYTADAFIDLRGAKTVDDYLGTLSRRRRGNARNEISRFRRDGFSVAEADIDALPVIVAQEADTWARHGDPIGFDRLWQLRAPLAQHLAGRRRLLVCTDSADQVVACAIHLIGRDRYHCFTYGVSYPARQGVYANLTFYEPAAYAIAHGQSRLMLGDTTLHAKALRGAAIRPLQAYTLAFHADGTAFYRDLGERLGDQVRKEIGAAAEATLGKSIR
ncbi:MAG TPA: GNAT family N-acetyltransferase [Streptosporangiaceae bacterium]|nr:GNAT family N-acetyltransferase [Streptosporangiaceae bacterium]